MDDFRRKYEEVYTMCSHKIVFWYGQDDMMLKATCSECGQEWSRDHIEAAILKADLAVDELIKGAGLDPMAVGEPMRMFAYDTVYKIGLNQALHIYYKTIPFGSGVPSAEDILRVNEALSPSDWTYEQLLQECFKFVAPFINIIMNDYARRS